MHPIPFFLVTRRIVFRVIDVFIMIILFQIWPEQVYRFSTRKQLPEKGKRNKVNSLSIPLPFTVNNNEVRGINYMEECNIVMRGKSLSPSKIKKINPPIFLTSIVTAAQIMRFEKHFEKKSTVLVYGDARNLLPYVKRNYDCLYLRVSEIDCNEMDRKRENSIVDMNAIKTIMPHVRYIPLVKNLYPKLPSPNSWAPTGSGLVAIGALFPFAEKMNIYGWDFHLNSSPAEMNYWELLLNMYDYQCDRRSRNHFESMMINLYYGYHISKLPNVTVHGYLGQLDRHKKIIDRIERVLFD